MKETLYNAQGLDQTRICRAFRWIITFRDFPVGSRQTVDGDSMMTEALTFFTKGRAEFYLDGVRREDRVPGILSSEYEPVGQGGTFELRYVEPTTRVCIPASINRFELPNVSKLWFEEPSHLVAEAGRQFLVCLGSVSSSTKVFQEEQSFKVSESQILHVSAGTMLLEFHYEKT